MSFDILETQDSILIFEQKNKLLHTLDHEAYELLLALHNGESVTEICSYAANQKVCIKNLSQLESTWKGLNLLQESENTLYKKDDSLFLTPSLETYQLYSNSNLLKEYLVSLYSVCKTETINSKYSILIEAIEDKKNKCFTITIDHIECHSNLTFEQTILILCFELGELATNEKPRLFTAHASGLNRDNFTFILPADAGSGKSTLTAYLIKHGFNLINDDIVPINFDGSASCITSPIKIKEGSWQVLGEFYPKIRTSHIFKRSDNQSIKHITTDKSRHATPGKEYPVNALVFPQYQENTQTKLRELTNTEKLRYFLNSKPYFPHKFTKSYLKQVTSWLSEVRAWKLEYCSLHEALEEIENILALKNEK